MKLTDHQYSLLNEKLTAMFSASKVRVRTDPPSGDVFISVHCPQVDPGRYGDMMTKVYSLTQHQISPKEIMYDEKNSRYVICYSENSLARDLR